MKMFAKYPFDVSSGKSETAIANRLHDHVDHVSVS